MQNPFHVSYDELRKRSILYVRGDIVYKVAREGRRLDLNRIEPISKGQRLIALHILCLKKHTLRLRHGIHAEVSIVSL